MEREGTSLPQALQDCLDITIEMSAIGAADMILPIIEGSAEAAGRIAAARAMQAERGGLNAHLTDEALNRYATPDDAGRLFMLRIGEAGAVTRRAWVPLQRFARTLADLDGSEIVRRRHVAQAWLWRQPST